jgi:hypothetical protein
MRRTAEFLPEMNKTQLGISAEIKESSQTATKLAWGAIGLNVLILLVTGFGVWASFKVSELSNLQTEVKTLRQNLTDEVESNSQIRKRVVLLEKKLAASLKKASPKPAPEQEK